MVRIHAGEPISSFASIRKHVEILKCRSEKDFRDRTWNSIRLFSRDALFADFSSPAVSYAWLALVALHLGSHSPQFLLQFA